MKFISNYWQYLTVFVVIILSLYMVFWGYQRLDGLQMILMFSIIALAIHQFEEFVYPGGAPIVVNKASFREEVDFSHYPGNTLSTFVVNMSVYVLYICALIFPQLIWLGLATMIFNLMQFFGHGYSINRALGTWYNPGLVSSVVFFLPISIYYVYYVHHFHLVNFVTWILAILVYFIAVFLTITLPFEKLKSRKSQYVISDWQHEQYNKVLEFAKFKKG
ncbi:HXXEE domain-containing protein [Staphylococcus gallinarum]|uniref:HXXEE domain-containing protein n=1 Tax=Staphylococcus gallinarum TaxID=1293 RepID=UPI001E579E07|nr:HXXEE domain-containing protein [Staphylococcus gallinarum]MCD8899623.1 HXXEE domain-containing protein [Staphylococcus gallinarum]